MIGYKNAFLFVLNNTYNRMVNGQYHGRETENGVKLAIEYLNNERAETLTEQQISHVCRLTCYRGRVTEYKLLTTK